MAEKKEDVQKKILFIILIVIIFVSVLGTWTILGAIDNIKAQAVREAQVKQHAVTGATVNLEILPSRAGRGR